MIQQIERIDAIPLIAHGLIHMHVHDTIDRMYQPPTNWEGLTYGQLAVLFLTDGIHSLTHRLSGMEAWRIQPKTVREQVTGWAVNAHDATDDRLGRMLEVFGEEDDNSTEFQVQMGQPLITAHELPTAIGREDTTSFNGDHQKDHGRVPFGQSQNHRPDLLQVKQGLGTIDPAGIPLMTETISGEKADAPCYVPAGRRMVKTIGRPDFLWMADGQAASANTRATIAKEQGDYLFPLPMTGDIPAILKEAGLNPPEEPQAIMLSPKTGEEDEGTRDVGVGWMLENRTEAEAEDGSMHTWQERWMLSRSDAHAERQKKAIKARLAPAAKKLHARKPKQPEHADTFLKRAETLLKETTVTALITLKMNEAVHSKKKYTTKGRPGPNTPYDLVEIRNLARSVQQHAAAIDECLSLAGWRIYVTNPSSEKLSLNQRTPSYRNEWSVERGFHRFKNGCLPALPLFLRLPKRMTGVLRLLMIALQALTLIEYVSRRSLEKENGTIAGLVPGNPTMKTDRPTAERLLSRLDGIHLLIRETDTSIHGTVIETLHPLQCRILSLLHIPIHLYALKFSIQKIKNST